MFQHIAATGSPLVLSLVTDETPERVRVQTMDVALLPLLGLGPERGRGFSAPDAEPGADPVVMVSEAFWETHLGRREDVVGSTINLHGLHMTIVGVMSRSFWFGSRGVDMWLPLPSRDDGGSAPVLNRTRNGNAADHDCRAHRDYRAMRPRHAHRSGANTQIRIAAGSSRCERCEPRNGLCRLAPDALL